MFVVFTNAQCASNLHGHGCTCSLSMHIVLKNINWPNGLGFVGTTIIRNSYIFGILLLLCLYIKTDIEIEITKRHHA